MLLAAARERGLSEIRFQHELRTFTQDTDGVTATILNRADGEELQVRAAYLLGADGPQSRVRELLRIPMHGQTGLSHYVMILFRADLTPWVADRPPSIVFIAGPDGPGPLLTLNGTDRWAFMALYDPAQGQRAEDFSPDRCTALVRSIVGVSDLPVEILATSPWTASAILADGYQEGRVVLAGDAAHETTPSGGFGMNTGIQDVHNLAWKLAAVLAGQADRSLLDTYEVERRPVGQAVVEQSLRNLAAVERGGGTTAAVPAAGGAGTSGMASPGNSTRGPQLLSEWGLIFGATYASAAVISDGTAPPTVADPVTEYVPTARPGHRAPHIWLERGGERISTLDLFGTTFVLLAGALGGVWCQAAAELSQKQHIPLPAYRVGPDGDLVDRGAAWAKAYGVEEEGAVLVRPDGYVGWRSRAGVTDPQAQLHEVLTRVLGHGERTQ